MAETRMLPKSNPRSTGISRLSTQVARPRAAGTVASHVSASPGAGRATHAHVAAARNPVAAPIPSAKNASLDGATVQIIAQGGTSPASQRPAVQILGPRATGLPPAPAPLALDVDQMMLIAHLLEGFMGKAVADGDKPNAAIAQGALAGLSQMMAAPPGSVYGHPQSASLAPTIVAPTTGGGSPAGVQFDTPQVTIIPAPVRNATKPVAEASVDVVDVVPTAQAPAAQATAAQDA